MILRLMLDVNVWVNHFLSVSRDREGSAARQLVRCAFDGHCRLGPIQPVISHAMLDTLQDVLTDLAFPEALAEAARNAAETAALEGMNRAPPHIVPGGGVQPLRDAEDRGVLETAIAARADLLVTNNMANFLPGPRAGIDAEMVRVGHDGRAEVLLVRPTGSADGIVIASVFATRAWLVDGVAPPPSILGRFQRQTGVDARGAGR